MIPSTDVSDPDQGNSTDLNNSAPLDLPREYHDAWKANQDWLENTKNIKESGHGQEPKTIVKERIEIKDRQGKETKVDSEGTENNANYVVRLMNGDVCCITAETFQRMSAISERPDDSLVSSHNFRSREEHPKMQIKTEERLISSEDMIDIYNVLGADFQSLFASQKDYQEPEIAESDNTGEERTHTAHRTTEKDLSKEKTKQQDSTKREVNLQCSNKKHVYPKPARRHLGMEKGQTHKNDEVHTSGKTHGKMSQGKADELVDKTFSNGNGHHKAYEPVATLKGWITENIAFLTDWISGIIE
ncbi:hypothetical protein ACLMJK_002600 [Lecanora helva]